MAYWRQRIAFFEHAAEHHGDNPVVKAVDRLIVVPPFEIHPLFQISSALLPDGAVPHALLDPELLHPLQAGSWDQVSEVSHGALQVVKPTAFQVRCPAAAIANSPVFCVMIESMKVKVTRCMWSHLQRKIGVALLKSENDGQAFQVKCLLPYGAGFRRHNSATSLKQAIAIEMEHGDRIIGPSLFILMA